MDDKRCPLVLHRRLESTTPIYDWARGAGMASIVKNLHVTIATVRSSVPWSDIAPLATDSITVTGSMGIVRLGRRAWCLEIDPKPFTDRWQWMKDRFEIDYPDAFHAHMTIARKDEFDDQLRYDGELTFGPEIIMPFTPSRNKPRAKKLF